MNEAFVRIDTNKDDMISFDELKLGCGIIFNEKFSDILIKMLLDQIDYDKNGL